MKNMDVGIDLVDVSRMRNILGEQREHFLTKTFSPLEQEYCYSHKDPAPHFAGTFAAKEAVRKATGMTSPFNEIEVRHASSGKPEIWIRGFLAPYIHVSITHTDSSAAAVAVAEN